MSARLRFVALVALAESSEPADWSRLERLARKLQRAAAVVADHVEAERKGSA
jgi:hypothetical protein